MVKNSKSNHNFLKDLITEAYSLNKRYAEESTTNMSIKIEIKEEDMRNKVRMLNFLERSRTLPYLKSWYESFQKSDEIYPLTYYLPGYSSEFINIILRESEIFHLTIHIKFHKNLTNTFNLVMIFSLWFERPLEENSLNLEYINFLNRDLLLGYRLKNKLRLLKYEELSLSNTDAYNPNIKKNISNQWIASKPLFFITFGLKLLNANPFRLIDDLLMHLGKIDEAISDSMGEDLERHEQFFDSFSLELKDFLLRGRELFQVAGESLEFLTKTPKEPIHTSEESKINRKEIHALTPKMLLSMFEEAFQKDNIEKEPVEDQGFRSLSEIYKEFKTRYDFSKQTYYNCFSTSNFELILEKRKRGKKGGGYEYRVRKTRVEVQIDENDLAEDFMREKMLIEKALVHYNRKKLNSSISIFVDVLSIPSRQLQEDKELFLGSKYYLGKSYYKHKQFQKALEIFTEINHENDNLIEANYYMLKIYLNLHMYAELSDLLKITHQKITEIFTEYDIKYNRYSNSFDYYEKIQNQDFIFFINTDKVEKLFKRSARKPIGGFRTNEYEEFSKNQLPSLRAMRVLTLVLQTTIELKRREIFRLVLKNDDKKVGESINDFLELFKKKEYQNCFGQNIFFLLYPHYFKVLFKMHLPSYDLTFFNTEMEKIYPGFTKHSTPYHYDLDRDFKLEHEALNFLNEINKFRHLVLLKEAGELPTLFNKKEEPIIRINEKLNFPTIEFMVEYIYSEAFIPYKNGTIEVLIQGIKKRLQSGEIHEGNNIGDLLRFWEQMFGVWGYYERPNKLLDRIEYGMLLCKENNLPDLIKSLEKLHVDLKDSIEALNKLRIQAKQETLQRIFKILAKEYVPKKRLINTVNLEHETFVDYDDYINKIYPKIEGVIEDYERKFKLRIKLSSKEVADDVYPYFKSISIHYRSMLHGFNLLIPQRTSDTTISLKNDFIYTYADNNTFEDNLSEILNKLVDLMQLNYHKLTINTELLKNEKFYEKFTLCFQKEFQNDFFEFNLKKTAKNDGIIIHISQKK